MGGCNRRHRVCIARDLHSLTHLEPFSLAKINIRYGYRQLCRIARKQKDHDFLATPLQGNRSLHPYILNVAKCKQNKFEVSFFALTETSPNQCSVKRPTTSHTDTQDMSVGQLMAIPNLYDHHCRTSVRH